MENRRSWIDLVNVLRTRFDAYSARAVLDETLAIAALPKKATYVAREIDRVAEAMAARTDRVAPVVAGLNAEAAAIR